MRLSTVLAIPALLLAAPSLRAQGPSVGDTTTAHLIRMKSDLRNLVVAQESYFAKHSVYAEQIGDLQFQPSMNDVVRLTVAQVRGWAGEARSDRLPGVSCIVWVNLADKDQPHTGKNKLVPREGEPVCDFDAEAATSTR